jgi:aryl-alcohol dehydrogenase-like predicted oxidoreductase
LLYPSEKSIGETLHRRALKPSRERMKYGEVAGVNKPISRLALGTMLEGTTFPRADAGVLFDDFYERGGNCFDTAHIYGTEPIFGDWLQKRGVREDVVVLVKGGHTPDCYPEAITRQFLTSLERLKLDYADIYMMHRDNEEISVGEFIECLNEHVRAGRIRAFGGSNWSLKRVEEANNYAREKGLQGFAAVSNNFSLARMVDPIWAGSISTSDAESRAWLEKNQMPIFSWSSQARGFFARGDRNFTADGELARCWYSDDNFERLERVQQMAKERGVTPISVAAAYVLSQPFPTFAIIGPRAPWETRTSIDAFEVELSPEDVKWLNLEA